MQSPFSSVPLKTLAHKNRSLSLHVTFSSLQVRPHVCIRMQPVVCCLARLSSVQLCSRTTMISHPASRYWLGVLEAYTKARREVTDCVLQRTLSLYSTQEGRQNFLAQEMETTTQAGSIWLDSLKRSVQFESQIVRLRTKRKKEKRLQFCWWFFSP